MAILHEYNRTLRERVIDNYTTRSTKRYDFNDESQCNTTVLDCIGPRVRALFLPGLLHLRRRGTSGDLNVLLA